MPTFVPVSGQIAPNGLPLALRLVVLGYNSVILFHHLTRLIDRKDLGDMGSKSLFTIQSLVRRRAHPHATYLTEKPGAGSVVYNFDATFLCEIKPDQVMRYEIRDEPLQELSTCHLTGAIVVDVGNSTANMSDRWNRNNGRKLITRKTQQIQTQSG